MKIQRVGKTWYVLTNNNIPMFAGSLQEVVSQVEEYLAE